MERQGEEEHEGTKGGVGLEVHMDMMTATLQVSVWSLVVPVPISVFWYKGSSLLLTSSRLSAVHDNLLQDEDKEEANSYDKLWKGEAGLFKTIKRLNGLHIKSEKLRNE